MTHSSFDRIIAASLLTLLACRWWFPTADGSNRKSTITKTRSTLCPRKHCARPQKPPLWLRENQVLLTNNDNRERERDQCFEYQIFRHEHRALPCPATLKSYARELVETFCGVTSHGGREEQITLAREQFRFEFISMFEAGMFVWRITNFRGSRFRRTETVTENSTSYQTKQS